MDEHIREDQSLLDDWYVSSNYVSKKTNFFLIIISAKYCTSSITKSIHQTTK